jgi:hypothetical protein
MDNGGLTPLFYDGGLTPLFYGGLTPLFFIPFFPPCGALQH